MLVVTFNQEKALVGAFSLTAKFDGSFELYSVSTGLVLVTVLSCSCVSGRTPLRLVRFMTGRYWAATASLCRLRWPLLQPGTQGGAPDTHSSNLICTSWQTQFERSVRIHCITTRITRVVWSSPKSPWLHPAREDKLSGDDQVAKQRNDVERLHQLQWVGNSWKYEVVSIYSASPIIPHFKLMHKNEHHPINHQISAQNWHNWNNGLHQLFSAPAGVCNCGVLVVVCCWRCGAKW